MAENLMNKDHKATNKPYRDNYDHVYPEEERERQRKRLVKNQEKKTAHQKRLKGMHKTY